jgi:hypothetical protein
METKSNGRLNPKRWQDARRARPVAPLFSGRPYLEAKEPTRVDRAECIGRGGLLAAGAAVTAYEAGRVRCQS